MTNNISKVNNIYTSINIPSLGVFIIFSILLLGCIFCSFSRKLTLEPDKLVKD